MKYGLPVIGMPRSAPGVTASTSSICAGQLPVQPSPFQPSESGDEQGLEVALVEVRGDVAFDVGTVGVEGVQVARAHPRGQFEAYVQQLAHLEVVGRVRLIVA